MSHLSSAVADVPVAKLLAVWWACVLAYQDIRFRRLSNILTLGAIAVGLIWWIFMGASILGANGISMLKGSITALVLTVPGYMIRKLGAGDVKLLVAVAVMGGFASTLVTFVIGAFAALAVAIATVWLAQRLSFDRSSHTGKWLPFGAALAFGFVVTILTGPVGELQ